MKKFLMITLALLTLGSQMEVAAEKKEKKEKKGLKWDWDGQTLSGNVEIDTYIRTIDTLYNKVNSYVDSMSKYQMVDPIIFENKTTGKKYEMVYMLDEEGKLVTRGTVNWQCAQALMQGANIILDMTNAGLSSANAALTLPDLGLKAIKFAKYVKGGPAVISAGTKAIKDVRKRWLNNSRTWKDMKVDAIEDPKSLNYEGMTDALAEKLNKCVYIREIKEASNTTKEAKNEKQQNMDMDDALEIIAKKEQAKEDARKSNENLDDGFDKLLEDANA